MKKYRLRLFIYITFLFVILGIIGGTCFNTWQKIYENKKIKSELEEKYNALIEDEETLEGKVVQLQDPEYVAKYAREKYFYTGDGELIIDYSDKKEE